MTDLLLIFPPQWSPFQPALSLPSLSAWLKRAGFDVRSLDLNLMFYEWLLSDECADILCRQVEELDWDLDVRRAYKAIFRSATDFRNDVRSLKALALPDDGRSHGDYVTRNYLAVNSLQTYLDAVSEVEQTFSISPYGFQLAADSLDVVDLEKAVATPPPLIGRFLENALQEHILPAQPHAFGLSCIGQEQLYFTLLLGALLKQRADGPVIVGGTILSRIFERGALQRHWFGKYLDIIVRNEGEKPAEKLLQNVRSGRALTQDVPGIVYREDDRLVSSPPCAPLSVEELPVPDFDDAPLDRYLSPEITLPLLSARGCYWGKCEFCHHGMVYGEKYAPYRVDSVLNTVRELASRYGVKHFAFNDEAIPPKTARAIARQFPSYGESGWTFTGLIKFEPFYQQADFQAMYDVGFRSLYVGMESASERVLELMRKNSKRETIVTNLTDATSADIWMQCFIFFGFPGETDDDAQETFDFIVNNPSIVSNFGASTFSLEHNAPIFHHYEDFGVSLKVADGNRVDVYYDYEAGRGISASRAQEWQQRLKEAAADIPTYHATKWIPRELLMCMLSVMTPRELALAGQEIMSGGGLPAAARLTEIATRAEPSLHDGARLVVNRVNGCSLVLSGAAATLFDLFYARAVRVSEMRDLSPLLFEKLRVR